MKLLWILLPFADTFSFTKGFRQTGIESLSLRYFAETTGSTLLNFQQVAMRGSLSSPIVVSVGRCWIDDRFDLGNAICRKAALLCMLANHSYVRRDIYTVEFVVGDIAVLPLNLCAEVL